MAKFLYLFTGGEMAATPEAQEEQMQEWIAWFGTLGDSVVDMGNAFGASSTVTNGTASDGGAQTGRLLDHQRRISRRGYEEGRRMSRPALWWQR